VKIVWTLAAQPAGPGESLLVTRTRAAATDPESRKRFRRYWAPMSAGIILIRYAGPAPGQEGSRTARAAGRRPTRMRPRALRILLQVLGLVMRRTEERNLLAIKAALE
jgi:hypothetical protein